MRGRSPGDQAAELSKRDMVVQIDQSDHMFEWLHALATILVMVIKEKAITGGLTASERFRAMTARLMVGADGQLTI